MVKNFNKWLEKHASGYERRIILGHCKNPSLNLDQLRGHGKGLIFMRYFSLKHKTFRDWLISQGFNKYEIRVIQKYCESLHIFVYDYRLKRVYKYTRCIVGLMDSYYHTEIKQPLNRYYLHGCATYGDSEFSDMGNFFYGFQDYGEFEFTFDQILDILLNNRYNINSFQFFIGLGKEKKIIPLSEIQR